ncbi:MAG: ABC transporter ATP-binding protein/permease [Planctomycetes bacterium]|nr:ABC transporter ATP-binding protein/permease [Planctomycetota bacterium]
MPPPATSVLLEVHDLCYSYGGLKAADQVSFHVGRGEIFGLLGPNGAGKTTTICCVAGLKRPQGGTLRFAGADFAPNRSAEQRRRLGVVPQELALYDGLTARENLEFFAAVAGLGGARARAAVERALDLAGLAERAEDRVSAYSGGMKRRLNLVIGCLHDPELIILDEPTVGVDPQSRNHRGGRHPGGEPRAGVPQAHRKEAARHMNPLHATWTLAQKDLRLYLRDRTGMLLGFGLPVVLVLAFGFVYKMAFGRSGGMSSTTLWVADLDQSDRSRAFLAALRENTMLSIRPREGEDAAPAGDLKGKVEDGEAHHALVIERGFELALDAGSFPALTMYRDPDRTLEAQLVSIALMQSFLGAADPQEAAPLMTARALELAGLPDEWSERIQTLSRAFSGSVEALFVEAEDEGLLQAAAPDEEPAAFDFSSVMRGLVPVRNVDIKPPDRPKELSYMLAHNVSGISVMMLMFGLVACGTLLIQEREQGTLRRLLLSPMQRRSILWGKFLFTAIIGVLQLAVMFAVGELVFSVSLLRDPLTLLVLSAALVFSVTAFGMLIASLARTTRQAEGLSTIIILVMSAVGGAWFPIQMFDLPLASEIVAKCTLTWWAMSAFQGMFWHGKPWTDPTMLGQLGVLLAFGAVASCCAQVAFRRRYVEA